MKFFDRLATLATVSAVCLWVAACGGGSSGSSTPPPVTPSISVAPSTAVIGTQQQFTATVTGISSNAVTWTVAAPSGSSASAGDISSTGLYNTPFPAPATVTVTATSTTMT
ncbi:MAG: hypothetical protein WBE41_06290, partial [Terracidiphilus sp.]